MPDQGMGRFEEGYDPTLYHGHPQTAILYAKNSGFTVTEENEKTIASRVDMGGSFLLSKKSEERWCWIRTA